MSNLLAPRVALSWPASALGANFGGYRLYRRPAAQPAASWTLIATPGTRALAAGVTPATVETNSLQFTDYEAGWASTNRWVDGWDYYVSSVDATTGAESTPSFVDARNIVAADNDAWIVSNINPALNTPIDRLNAATVVDQDTTSTYTVAGRDFYVTRRRLEDPGRIIDLTGQWDQWAGTSEYGEDGVRRWRAAAASGLAVCVHTPFGDRYIGALGDPRVRRDLGPLIEVTGKLYETSRTTAGVADTNVACGLVLDGATDYVLGPTTDGTPATAKVNPNSSAFTVFVYGTPGAAGGSDYILGKGNGGGGADGVYLRTTGVANQIQFVADGAGGAATISAVAASLFNPSSPVLIAGTSTTTAQALYGSPSGYSSALGTAATAHGAISNAVAWCLGNDNGGAGVGTFMPGTFYAWGLYQRVLTAAELTNLEYYLRGYPGYRPPGGPTMWFDTRDSRCWNGFGSSLTDLSGNAWAGTITGAPPVVGLPWDLDLDRF